MAQKLSTQERLNLLDKLSNNFNKKKKEVRTGRLGFNKELQDKLKVEFIETPSLNLNYALGGGIARGRATIVAGKPDSGKTFLLLETIAKKQKQDPNFIAGWLESEGSLSLETLEQIGIDLDRFYYDEIDREGAAEEALDKTEAVIMQGLVDIFVVNSLKCLVPKEELQKSMESVQVGLQARLNAKMMRKITTAITETNTAFVMIQHLTTQINSMSRDPLIVAGGEAIKYGASVIVDLRKRSMSEADPFKKEEATKIAVTIQKNHVITNRFPYCKLEYYAVFGQGIDNYLELTDIAINKGILIKKGAFISIPDENGSPKIVNGEKMQWQGNARFKAYCKENDEFFQNMIKAIEGDGIIKFLSEEESQEYIEDDKNLEEYERELNENEEDILAESRK